MCCVCCVCVSLLHAPSKIVIKFLLFFLRRRLSFVWMFWCLTSSSIVFRIAWHGMALLAHIHFDSLSHTMCLQILAKCVGNFHLKYRCSKLEFSLTFNPIQAPGSANTNSSMYEWNINALLLFYFESLSKRNILLHREIKWKNHCV